MHCIQLSIVLSISLLFLKTKAQQDLKQLAKANNEASFSLLKTFPAEENVFFSPISIYTALAMVYGAARGNTAEEMSNVLQYYKAGLNNRNIHQHFGALLNLLNNTNDEYKLEIANAILSQIDYNVLPEYKELLRKDYNALHQEVDFARNSERAVAEINNWVKHKTNGKISSIVQNLPALTRMILLNAIYFKGTWKKTFDVDSTKNEIFYNYGLNTVSVPTMKIKETFPYAEFRREGFNALELPYKGEDISMVILLPNELDGLDKLVRRIDGDKLQTIFSNLRPKKLDIRIPKFKMEDFREIKQSLQQLGMQDAFNNRADFSGISGKRDLYISNILHKAVIEVNEEGSEAAAVTDAVFTLRVALNRNLTPTFFINHPFLFFIRDRRTDMILFSGRINKF